ncbi:hypothetical protein [Corynebacterium freiburgense]|uniref:hypothetical protein n=1 Tax=Corynebacterium freiburgense TaxID=556548 RepID=UPI00041E45F4|nr:hypothetical protein [Corynebacterium freiburgense]WJZ01394.1 hypothetical protein CFREI_00385 [Corynebacterium freiburgense]
MTHRAPRTALLHAELAHHDGAIQRTIGINDALSLAEVAGVLRTCFNLQANSPWSFRTGSEPLDSQDCLHQYPLLTFQWGLWDIHLETLETYPRDRGTPRALCIAGSGSLSGEFDPSGINELLTGKATTQAVLKKVHPEVASIIERSRIRDFVSLLQALDLSTPTKSTKRTRQELPLEEDAAGRDAFWSLILALSCLSGPRLTDHIAETTMEALGWVDDDDSRLSADGIRALCASSLKVLRTIVGNSVVERLDCYRDLLRAPGFMEESE